MFTFWPILPLEALLYWTLFLLYIFNTIFIIFIGHYFLPIVYFIFILTQCLLPVSVVSKGNSCMLLKYNNNRNKQNTTFFFNLIFCFCWGGVPLIGKDSFMLCVIENYIFHIRHYIVITLFFKVWAVNLPHQLHVRA